MDDGLTNLTVITCRYLLYYKTSFLNISTSISIYHYISDSVRCISTQYHQYSVLSCFNFIHFPITYFLDYFSDYFSTGSVSSRVPSSTIQIRYNIPYKLSRVDLKHRIVQIIIYFRIIIFLTINIYLNIFKSISLLFLLFFLFFLFLSSFFFLPFFLLRPFFFDLTRPPKSLICTETVDIHTQVLTIQLLLRLYRYVLYGGSKNVRI